ncbi:DUF2585 family protein [Aureimonas mangrovi]|uniref:DUF2585 family protein n=1 Tax=Aureimonas mangrovi TaxID=2758041 RepID=UPI00163DCDC4|nr:DUF2585 family protein [Aureimonas mangrovi]
MSRLAPSIDVDGRPAFAERLGTQIFLGASIVSALALWLAAVGRPLLCPCGTVALFISDVNSPQTSQQFADWYSLLHIVFGFGLWLVLDRIRPHWSVGQKLLVALASSAVWEAVENMPPVIEIFGNAPGTPPYAGDSILNAVSDTLFVAIGFYAARALPLPAVIALAIAFELFVWRMADDSYTLGTLRLISAAL